MCVYYDMFISNMWYGFMLYPICNVYVYCIMLRPTCNMCSVLWYVCIYIMICLYPTCDMLLFYVTYNPNMCGFYVMLCVLYVYCIHAEQGICNHVTYACYALHHSIIHRRVAPQHERHVAPQHHTHDYMYTHTHTCTHMHTNLLKGLPRGVLRHSVIQGLHNDRLRYAH